jgi:hypothetical protein
MMTDSMTPNHATARMFALLASSAGLAISLIAFGFRWSDNPLWFPRSGPLCFIPLFLASLHVASCCTIGDLREIAPSPLRRYIWGIIVFLLLSVLLPGNPRSNAWYLSLFVFGFVFLRWLYRQFANAEEQAGVSSSSTQDGG